MLTGAFLALINPARAGDPAPAEDAKLNRAAYSALQADAELSGLNIGVRVLTGGTAVLWGTATPAEVTRAVAILKEVPGVTKVTSTCDRAGAPDPLVARVEAGVRAPGPERVRPVPSTVEVVKVPPPATASAPVSRQTTVVEKPGEARVAAREPAARLLEPAAAAPPVDYAAVDRVRRSDPRFARLTFDLRDGRIVINGSAGDPAAAWDLARKVAPLVGDRDVVVGR
jgi:hypothetical protein